MTLKSRAKYGSVKEAVIAGHQHGLSVNELAARSGFHMRSIRSAAEDLSIALRRERRPFGSAKALVYEAHAQGMTVPQLAEASGFSRHTLYTALRRYGITLPRARQGRPTL
jgi:lambda repressor-like predicted transcriptional regulator